MRRLLMGLVVVASALPTGANADAACYFVPVLGGDSCTEVDWEHRDQAGYDHYMRQKALEPDDPKSLAAWRADNWVQANLAIERAQATWWRDAFVDDLPDGNRRGWFRLIDLTKLEEERRFQSVVYPCDVNYGNARSGGCVPDNRDYDCPELRSWGIVNIPVTGNDWMLLDDNHDGMGCEVEAVSE
jgi:hypothetical protein